MRIGDFARWLLAAVLLAVAAGGLVQTAQAQTCGSDYTIKEGESLADVAARVYGTSSQWPLIFYANQDRMGANASMLVPGLSIRVPCMAAQPGKSSPVSATAPSPSTPSPAIPSTAAPAESSTQAGGGGGAGGDIELSSVVRQIQFLTADGYTPFTDRALTNGGLITNIVSSAMNLIRDQSGGTFNYNVSWVNDWAAHLNPLLITRAFDAGFPWLKPDCAHLADLAPDAKYRCQKFFFSDPLFEVFTVLFVKADSPITFAKDDEIVGKTLCLPVGQSTHELDKNGRNWARESKVTLLRPQNMEECFRLLSTGSATAVVAPDLTGKSIAAALGIADKVKPLSRPVAIGTVHVIVPRTHPHASTMLYYINTALAKLKDSGEYDKIVDTHMSRFWASQERK
jgi:polar amino acid transport system substrate-binding protein